MNRIFTVEKDLIPHSLTEVIPGVTIQSQLGETVHVTVKIGPVEEKIKDADPDE